MIKNTWLTKTIIVTGALVFSIPTLAEVTLSETTVSSTKSEATVSSTKKPYQQRRQIVLLIARLRQLLFQILVIMALFLSIPKTFRASRQRVLVAVRFTTRPTLVAAVC